MLSSIHSIFRAILSDGRTEHVNIIKDDTIRGSLLSIIAPVSARVRESIINASQLPKEQGIEYNDDFTYESVQTYGTCQNIDESRMVFKDVMKELKENNVTEGMGEMTFTPETSKDTSGSTLRNSIESIYKDMKRKRVERGDEELESVLHKRRKYPNQKPRDAYQETLENLKDRLRPASDEEEEEEEDDPEWF